MMLRFCFSILYCCLFAIIGNVFCISRYPEFVNDVTNRWVYDNFDGKKQVTGDAVVFRLNPFSDVLEILLIRRDKGPHTNGWATPGGLKEGAFDASFILRELLEEAVGVDKEAYMQSCIMYSQDLQVKKDAVLWDVRAHINPDVEGKVVWMSKDFVPVSGDDAKHARFLTVQDVIDGHYDIAFRHAEWIKESIQLMGAHPVYGQYFSKFTTADQLKKIDEVIARSKDRNLGMAQLVNLKRSCDGRALILGEDGEPIFPPERLLEKTFFESYGAWVSVLSLGVGASAVISSLLFYKYKK